MPERTVLVGARVPARVKNQVRRIAQREGMTESAWVRIAISQAAGAEAPRGQEGDRLRDELAKLLKAFEPEDQTARRTKPKARRRRKRAARKARAR